MVSGRSTLNRPERLNAMNRQLIDDTQRAFADANEDPATRGHHFHRRRTGLLRRRRPQRAHPTRRARPRPAIWWTRSNRSTEEIVLGPKPVVGAINGWAVGGGFEWAINCDFPIWAADATGFFPEVSLNIFVTGGVTSLLPALVGLTTAREMLFLGERYDAASSARDRRRLASGARRTAARGGQRRWRRGWPACHHSPHGP